MGVPINPTPALTNPHQKLSPKILQHYPLDNPLPSISQTALNVPLALTFPFYLQKNKIPEAVRPRHPLPFLLPHATPPLNSACVSPEGLHATVQEYRAHWGWCCLAEDLCFCGLLEEGGDIWGRFGVVWTGGAFWDGCQKADGDYGGRHAVLSAREGVSQTRPIADL